MLKREKYIWTEESVRGFSCVESKLQDSHVLVNPRLDHPVIIQNDASGKTNDFLSTLMYGNDSRLIALGRKVLLDTEQCYATLDKKLVSCFLP